MYSFFGTTELSDKSPVCFSAQKSPGRHHGVSPGLDMSLFHFGFRNGWDDWDLQPLHIPNDSIFAYDLHYKYANR